MKKVDSLILNRADFSTMWRCHGIPCFIFFLRTNGKNEHLDENEFRHSYGNYYLISAIFKVLSQQLRGTLSTAFRRHAIFEDFTDIDQHTC